MNIFVGLFGLFSILFAIFTQIKYSKFKKHTKKLAEKADIRNDQKESFTAEVARSNSELNSKPFDVLTGLPGRVAFDDRVEQALHQAKRYQIISGVLSINIDNFAEVNKFGQNIGDQVLVQISDRLKSCIRQVDSLTRYAGNNFIILMPQLSQAETAAYVAQRIQENLLPLFSVDGHEFYLTASMGIAIYPLDADNFEQLMQHANLALREAKKNGKNNYRFYSQETQVLGERDLIIAQYFREDEDLNYLSIRYFPQVVTDTGEIVGVQIIPCLNHPELRELLWPEFKKISENTGKTTEIIEFALRKISQQLIEWKSSNLNLKWVSLSIDPAQLENTHFVFQISKVVESLDFKNVPLVLEITDSPFQHQSKLTEKSLSLLALSGIQFAIEVYALGHSSLHRFPSVKLNYFKISSKLVENIVLQPANEKILTAMIGLANSTDISVIAEGINNSRQKAVLRQVGCNIMQGDLFDETLLPMPILVEKN